MKNMKRNIKFKQHSFIVVFFLSCILLHAQNDSIFYPESSVIRDKLIESWFTQDINVLRDQSSEIFQNEIGEYFLIRAEEKEGVMEIILAPLVRQTLEVQDYSSMSDNFVNGLDLDKPSITIETWPKDGYGSWVLYRDSQTGKNIKIRYYIMNDREVFLEFLPGKDKSYASFSIFNALVAHNAPVPVTFDYFYTATLKDIYKLTQNILPWKYIDVNDTVYADTIQMVTVIRRLLPDAQKAQMFVSDTSQYDFLRWIIDGLVKPLTGGTLFESPLFVPTIEADFMIPERQDTHKSYDFVRNLAAAAISAGTSLPYTYKTSNADVKIEPFSVITNEDGVHERINFITDIGYQVSAIEPLLYLLTATEDDVFYLGAVRELNKASERGRNAEQYYYNNAVAFFSWFDATGKINVTVFENGAEFTLEQFLEKYKESFVYLVRIKPSVNFFPEEPKLEDDSPALTGQ